MDELNNIGELESQGSMHADFNISNVYSVRKGGFGVDSKINTYLTTLSVSELQEDISFYESLSADKDWPVSQIIQREVDQERVNLISKKYLLGAGRTVKYFPPIIVALLPRDTDGNFARGYNFSADSTLGTKELILDKSVYRSNQAFRKIALEKTNESLVDGLFNYNTSAIFEHHLLCWDKTKFFAVVIDGQHRLDALIKSRNQDGVYKNALQDVLFLDVSPLVKEKSLFTPVEVLRTIFIDINTNAKSVGVVRRILMDEKDLASLCVQSLVESINNDGSSKAIDEFIPSTLIDWYGESIKHELPHLTGLITLHQVITDQLVEKKLVTIEDHRDTNKINAFISILNQNFFVDKTIQHQSEYQDIKTLEQSLTEYLKEKDITREMFAQEFNDGLDSILFNYDYRVLEVAQSNFEKFYLKPIIKILTTSIPYVKVIESLEKLGGLDSQTNLYRSLLLPVKKIRSNQNLTDAYINARRTLAEEVNPDFFLFYSVVGQKGLFHSFFEMLDDRFVEGSDADTVMVVQDEFVREMNQALTIMMEKEIKLFGKEAFTIPISGELEEYEKIASSFWEGILYENDRIIYNSQGVRAFADVLMFVSSLVKRIKSGQEIDSLASTSIRFSTIRTKRLLNKNFGARTDDEWERMSQAIIRNKKQYLISLFT